MRTSPLPFADSRNVAGLDRSAPGRSQHGHWRREGSTIVIGPPLGEVARSEGEVFELLPWLQQKWSDVVSPLGNWGSPSPAATPGPPQPIGGSSLGEAAARIAVEEWQRWGQGGIKESSASIRPRLEDYWRTGVGWLPNVSSWWSAVPWSAAFISWVMRKAGAGSAFKYSAAHTDYVYQAKLNRQRDASHAFTAYRVTEAVPRVGDLVCAPRDNSGVTYDNLDGSPRASHCDIVTEVRPGSITMIGGNVGDSVTRKVVTTDARGQLPGSYYAIVRVNGQTRTVSPEPSLGRYAPAPSPASGVAVPSAPSGGTELSGAHWVARFPTSRLTSSLVEPFRTNLNRFIAALEAAGARVSIAATLRPPQRAYLMHYAWAIDREAMSPSAVPPLAGVDIRWAHPHHGGGVDLAASRRAAREMVQSYRLAYKPALKSRHIERRAADMSITWDGPLSLVDGNGRLVTIASAPRTGNDNRELHAVGASYGVKKLLVDPPHWSDDGR